MEKLKYRLDHIGFSYGNDQPVLDGFNLTIPVGSVTCLIGPSGCGKTTLLQLMAGLLRPDSGTMQGFNEAIPSYIFQETRILPWKTVLGNVMFPLLNRFPKTEARRMALEYLSLVDLAQAQDQFPHQLSGGMKQRVSIARAFAFPSDLILLDEAFQGLDHHLRTHILELFIEIRKKTKRTAICVTHNIEEALKLGQKIVILGGAPLCVIEEVLVNQSSKDEIKSLILNRMI